MRTAGETVVTADESYSHLIRAVMRRLFCCTVGCQAISWISIVLIVIAAVVFWPEAPEMGLCNTTNDWSEMVKTVISDGQVVRAGYEILLSFYNPNKVSVALTHVDGTFTYNGDQVATLFLPVSTLAAGSVSDYVFSTLSELERIFSNF